MKYLFSFLQQSPHRLTRLLMALGILAVGLLVGTTLTLAQTSGGAIRACLKDGKLQTIGLADQLTCAEKEQDLEWSITGPQGIQGPQGPAGLTGPQGPAGSPGVLGYYQRKAVLEMTPGFASFVNANCDTGDVATGGGYFVGDYRINVYISAPSADLKWWTAWATNEGPATANLVAYVVCADLTP